jgi:hypothetical protein
MLLWSDYYVFKKALGKWLRCFFCDGSWNFVDLNAKLWSRFNSDFDAWWSWFIACHNLKQRWWTNRKCNFFFASKTDGGENGDCWCAKFSYSVWWLRVCSTVLMGFNHETLMSEIEIITLIVKENVKMWKKIWYKDQVIIDLFS